MAFFMDPSITIGTKALEVFYIFWGFLSVYAGVRNLRDTTNEARLGTFTFWVALGIVLAFGRWIPPMVDGILIVIMLVPAILKQVKPGKASVEDAPTADEMEDNYERIGMKIFVPALSIGIFAIIGALIKDISALTGCCVGVIVGCLILTGFSKKNTPKVYLNDSERLLSQMGALCMLPMLLASLGAIFTAAGVGDVIASLVGAIIPEGNMAAGIVVFAVGMMLFTMIMGNAFAAITVMTVGIGAPFVLALGADPALIGIIALTCGYCGTLLTPMAANFNIVPVAMLDMKDDMGVIKNQVLPALVMIIVQIVYMLIAA